MRKYFFILMLFSILVFQLTGCKKETLTTTVRLNEVVHSIFYAPQYVAIEKGFFAEEGITIELTTGFGADKSMTALLSNNADIALMGPEASIYVYNEGKEDYAMNFAQLTKRAGNFIIARDNLKDFSIKNLKGKTIIGGRPGGMPQMVLEYILTQNGLEPFKDVKIITNIDFTATAGSFINGTGDYTAEFEPTASKLEETGNYYVVASLGIESGNIPYTSYMALNSYIDKNPQTIQKFTNAIYKAQLWVEQHTPKEIATAIHPYFEDTDYDLLVKIIERYKNQGTWKTSPTFEEDGLDLLQDILILNRQLEHPVNYEDIVTTRFSKTAEEQGPEDSIK